MTASGPNNLAQFVAPAIVVWVSMVQCGPVLGWSHNSVSCSTMGDPLLLRPLVIPKQTDVGYIHLACTSDRPAEALMNHMHSLAPLIFCISFLKIPCVPVST